MATVEMTTTFVVSRLRIVVAVVVIVALMHACFCLPVCVRACM